MYIMLKLTEEEKNVLKNLLHKEYNGIDDKHRTDGYINKINRIHGKITQEENYT